MKTLSVIFAAFGLIALSYWLTIQVQGRRFQAESARHFVPKPASGEPAPAATPAEPENPAPSKRRVPATGSEIATLVIPRLGLSTVVVEGAGEHELRIAAGHIRGTPLPGETGNIGIAAHRDTYFRPLRHIRNDDVIELTTQERPYRYRVLAVRFHRIRAVKIHRACEMRRLRRRLDQSFAGFSR
jgi:sortase (surface protein transpeptidase)